MDAVSDASVPGPGCLTENDAIACAQREGDPQERERWYAHIDACPECRQLVSLLASGSDGEHGDGQPAMRFYPGRDVGRFQLRQPVGVGGMAVVFEAYDPVLHRSVAIKLLRLEAVSDRRVAHERLVRESRALARLNHPNVVSVHEAGISGDDVYIAMEFVAGTNVAEWIETRPAHREIVDAFIQVGKGLAAAHAIGLVHRDVKPLNMLRGGDGRVRIGDFGLVRQDGVEEPAKERFAPVGSPDDRDPTTRPGTALGTPMFMAPEVRAGAPANALSDQWSFATSLWFALGVDQPGHRVPRRLRDIISRGRATEPSARWPSVDAMVQSLGRRRRPTIWLAAGALALALVALSAGRWFAGSRPDPCDGAESAIAAVWDPTRAREIERVFLATGAPGAAPVAAEIQRTLDARARGWLEMRREACHDPQDRAHTTLPDEPGLRMQCLDRELAVLRMTTEHLLAQRSGSRVVPALEFVQNLPDASECGSVERLVRAQQLPADPARRRQLIAIHEEFDSAATDWWLNMNPAVLDVARRAVREAPDFAPLRARALQAIASVQRSKLDPEVVMTLREARATAAEAGDDGLQAELAIAAADASSFVPTSPEELAWTFDEADARITAIAQVAPSEADRLRYKYLVTRGASELLNHHAEPATKDLRSAVEIGTRIFGADSWRVARARGPLAMSLMAMNQYPEAVAEIEPTLSLIETYLGPDHPELARQCHLAAGAEFFAGNLPRALQLVQRSLAIDDKQGLLPNRAESLDLLADIEMAKGDFAAGIEALDLELALSDQVLAHVTNPPIIRTRIGCARGAIAALAEPDGPLRQRHALDAAHCFNALERQRPQIVAPLLESVLARSPESARDRLELDVRFALAKALWDRDLRDDEARALAEARRARLGCDRIPRAESVAKEIDAWIAAATSP
jgi:serine/threonine protein kinase/tetratricopeptide (TPR) repeat protein